MATRSSILAWRIPWTEEPGGLQSMGSLSQTRPRQLSTHQRRTVRPVPTDTVVTQTEGGQKARLQSLGWLLRKLCQKIADREET